MKYTSLFPFEKVPKGSAIVIYGAGFIGREYLAQVQEEKCYELLYMVDKDHEKIRSLKGVDVLEPQKLLCGANYDFVVIASKSYLYSIYEDLKKLGVPESKVIMTGSGEHKSYAHCHEDYIVYTIFKLLGKERFSYIDIGANDPYTNNNTAYLYMRGCRGINVEANPSLIDRLKQERPEDIVVNCGVGVERGVFPYYAFESHGHNTFSREMAEARQSVEKTFDIMQIPVVTLQEIIDQYADGIWPDYLSIDIEGLDYEVLNSCDFSSGSPIVICVEMNRDAESMKRFEEKGFTLFHITYFNMIYVRSDIMHRISEALGGVLS
jgi:FkbM family methyltransferase